MAAKNKSAAQKDKPSKESKGKSKKDKGEGGPPKAEIVVSLTEAQASKYMKNAKVITVQDLARQTGVKISAANKFLKEALAKGSVKRVGGYSGHYIYESISS